jgi:hypothetical protein
MTRIARACAVLALALLTALALAGPASAKKKPHKDRKGAHSAKVLPKQWSKQHKAKRASADPDGDGLTNWGEYRSHTKPKKADSDKDGIGDADEDYDRDGVDNGTELDAGTDPGRRDTDRDGQKDGAEDPDKDRLTNAAEDATDNHPRKADTDRDGIKDGDENAGVVQAFDGTTLTIALAVGGTLTATVDELTEVGCEDDDALLEDDGEFGDDEDLDDELGDDELDEDLEDDVEELSVKARLSEQGDEDDADDEEWFDEDVDDCTTEITPGTAVHEAEVEEGVFVALELVL